jgi:hypothetical protein
MYAAFEAGMEEWFSAKPNTTERLCGFPPCSITRLSAFFSVLLPLLLRLLELWWLLLLLPRKKKRCIA